MTLNRLHKILGKLIEQGYGRCEACIDKGSFVHNCESDGVTILPVSATDVRWIPNADDDGGPKINQDGSESVAQRVILGGDMYEPVSEEGRSE